MFEGKTLLLSSLGAFLFSLLAYFGSIATSTGEGDLDGQGLAAEDELDTGTVDASIASAEEELLPSIDPVKEASLPPQYFQDLEVFDKNWSYNYHQLARGENLHTVLLSLGLDGTATTTLLSLARGVFNLRRLLAGKLLRLSKDHRHFQYVVDDHSYLDVRLPSNELELGKAEILTVTFDRSLVRYSGEITKSLFETFQTKEIDISLALDLAHIFEWDIDFSTQIQNGDRFDILVERLTIAEQRAGHGRILAARFHNSGKEYAAFYYKGELEHGGYFDEDGKSLRKAFLKSPLKFSRISSTYSLSRFHPVHKVHRAHLGVDYAAPSGTPVRSIGDGRVVYSGWKGGLGKSVFIRHNGTYSSVYGHFSRIPGSMQVGRHIRQGEVVGYVGATGVATGPHLHFGVQRNNVYVNPLRITAPPSAPLPANCLADFRHLRDDYLGKLVDVAFEFPLDSTVAAN